MLRKRIIPCLQLNDQSLVKTVKFKNPAYIGDPVNTVRIFNELEVDELCFLDIRASLEGREPDLQMLQEISNECFMPLSYGGGIKSVEMAAKILSIGFEKIIINSCITEEGRLIKRLSERFGSQSVVASIDVRKNMFGKYITYSYSGAKKVKRDLVELAKELIYQGAGEILITSIDKEGTWGGYDIDLIKIISDEVSVPVIANGGGANQSDIDKVFNDTKAQAAAVGSSVVYQKQGMGVLINFPFKK